MSKLIVINGPAGVGKTTVAGLVHEKLKPSFLLSCDAVRKFINDYHRLPREGRTLRNKVVLSMLDTVLGEGMDVIIDQLHTTNEMLDSYINVAKKHHSHHYEYLLWVENKETLLDRFHGRQEGPTSHPATSLTDERVVRYWYKMQDLKIHRNRNNTILCDSRPAQDIAEEILQNSQ